MLFSARNFHVDPRSCRLSVEALEDRRLLAVVTVDTDQDVVDFNDGVTSLREAIFATNLVPGPDEIVFDFGHDGPATILLTQGELLITDSLTINGPGAELLTIDASGNDPTPDENNGDGSRVFRIDDGHVNENMEATLSGMTLTGGDVGNEGGAIDFQENLVLDSVWITDNVAIRGGGIASIRTNNAAAEPGTLRIVNSTISGNHARTIVGGRDPAGGYGGAVFSNGHLSTQIEQSTISGNTARYRTLQLYGDATVSHTTIANNEGGGIRNGFDTTTTIRSSIIAGNSQGYWLADLPSRGEINASNSLIGDTGTSSLPEAPLGMPDARGNLVGGPIHGLIDPQLAPLADNGGPTLTHALLPGSPAINAGDLNAIAGSEEVPLFDQRGDGFDRIFSRLDIGAYEVQELGDMNLLVDTLEDESDGDFSRGDLSLREAIELANANPAPDTIRFDKSLTGGTILLTMGQLTISDSVEVIGPGSDWLTIDASGNDPTPDEINGDGSRIFSIMRSTGDHAVLFGLTLTGGDVIGLGGAITSGANLTIENVVVHDNASRSGGGGIHFGESPFQGSRRRSNSTEGITSNEQSVDPVTPNVLRIIQSSISNNLATPVGTALGGGVFILGNVIAEISDSTVSGNRTLGVSAWGGGIAIGTLPSRGLEDRTEIVTLERTTIIGNSTAGRIANGGGISSYTANLIIRDSEISNNSTLNSEDYTDGGGLYASDGIVEVVGSTFTGNSTEGPGSWGAGFRFRGFDPESSFKMTASTVSGNSANGASSAGGGAHVRGYHVEILDSTFSDNRSNGLGGGIAVYNVDAATDPIVLRNLTISGNRSNDDGGGLLANAGPEQSVLLSHSTVVFNDSDANSSGDGSGGGISGSAQLDHTIVAGNIDHSGVANDIAGIVNANYSLIGFGASSLGPLADNGGPTHTHALLPGSPAINAGDPLAVAGEDGVPVFDQRGDPFGRIFGSRIDIGAYESQPLLADANGDHIVDGLDFLLIQIGGGDIARWNAEYGVSEPAIPPLVALVSEKVSIAAYWFSLPEAVVAERDAPLPTELANLPTFPALAWPVLEPAFDSSEFSTAVLEATEPPEDSSDAELDEAIVALFS